MTFLVAAQQGRECLTQCLQSSGGGEGGREREKTGEARRERKGGEGKGGREGGWEGRREGEEGRGEMDRRWRCIGSGSRYAE